MPSRAQRLAAAVRARIPSDGPRANAALLMISAPFDVLNMDWPDELAGILLLRHGRAVIGLNRSHSAARRHFSFWHEVGHYLMHASRGADAKLAMPAPCGGRDDSGREREANIFAAHVLMPAAWVRRLHAEGLPDFVMARRFGVTPLALRRRLGELRLSAPGRV